MKITKTEIQQMIEEEALNYLREVEEEGDKGCREAGARGGGAATMRGATPGAHARARSP